MSSIPPLRRTGKTPSRSLGGTEPGDGLAAIMLAVGAIALMIEPAIWLVETWQNSGYDSAGGHFFVAAAGLAIWSVTSPLRDRFRPPALPWGWIGAAAVARLAGQVFAVPYLGALAIPIGAYSLARIAGLDRRCRAVSPCWLAVFVGLTLPVELAVKRLFGYGFQHVAANGACSLLGAVYTDVTCNGLDIALRGQELFVDLSCSGVRTLLLFSILFAGLATVVRPTAKQAAAGFGLVVCAGVVVNSLRIALLTAGLAHEPSLGFDVMEHPWHMRVGLACLPVGLISLVLWARWVRHSPPADRDVRLPRSPNKRRAAVAAMVFAGVAAAASFVPQFPVHTSDRTDAIDLPAQLVGHAERPRIPGGVELRYFERYGGGVAIADYGPHTLVVVETNAPLRHLHRPERWLGDAGFTVEKIGHIPELLPADTYHLEGPDGGERRLDVTYVSDGGHIATGVAEAVWYWLSAPETTWRAYLRFHSPDTPPSRIAAFDRQIYQFFEINSRIHDR